MVPGSLFQSKKMQWRRRLRLRRRQKSPRQKVWAWGEGVRGDSKKRTFNILSTLGALASSLGWETAVNCPINE
jgi:hypothetical protein